MLIAAFKDERDLLRSVRAVRQGGWSIIEAFTPYAVHGLDEAMGWRRSRLSAVCFVCGVVGVSLALVFQFWSTTRSWAVNVGGQPWNSLPAFVPVTFEAMVLFAGLGVVLALLIRCRLYPGKKALLPLAAVTNDRFVLVIEEPDTLAAANHLRDVLESHRAVCSGCSDQDEFADRGR